MGIDWSLRIPRLPLFVKKNQNDFLLTFLSLMLDFMILGEVWEKSVMRASIPSLFHRKLSVLEFISNEFLPLSHHYFTENPIKFYQI